MTFHKVTVTVLLKCSPDSESEISLKIGQYLMKRACVRA